ncbi:MarR family winged helix-turn-helix transcriptional regulator [Mesorhizobium sp. IMUNJ 23232]|uniref:MarR family winged helix-turn-helix transcriptional regulator n=1 Tax=Mesorhizobium sp. IMUNJ 23232 TaxID=3376064 RepID=UPI0037BA82C6
MDITSELEKGDYWLDAFLPYLLYRVTMKSNAMMLATVRRQGINPSQWRVLAVLKSYGTLSMSAIGELTCMEQPTISRIISQLEETDHVARRLSAADARVAEISLTARGEGTFKKIVPAALRHQERAVDGLSRKELAELVKLLSKIEHNIM